ncbi:hypothetical protein P0D88_18555 [Paraburkholderia sp. RL18-103-BIB-C]|jgi:hypothetical protein
MTFDTANPLLVGMALSVTTTSLPATCGLFRQLSEFLIRANGLCRQRQQ